MGIEILFSSFVNLEYGEMKLVGTKIELDFSLLNDEIISIR